MMMTGCIIAEETTEVRFLNDANTSYDVRLTPASGSGEVNFTGIESGRVSERKAIDAGDYYVYAKESVKTDSLGNWKMTPRKYSYGGTYTETINKYGEITD
jgi:hypothetical protein